MTRTSVAAGPMASKRKPAWVRRKSEPPRHCKWCGETISPHKREGAEVCSDECGDAVSNHERASRTLAPGTLDPARNSVTPISRPTRSANGASRRHSRDGKGLRIYIAPSDTETTILAKFEAARERMRA